MANGVTNTGFQRKRLDEILSDKNTAVQGVLGTSLNLSPESPDGQINGVYAESDANLWELAEACYNAFAPSKATAATLSDLVKINGITREPASFSTVELTVTGANGTLIPSGSSVSNNDGVIFQTISDVTIVAGTGLVEARASEVGPIEALAGTLVNIDSPITGWSTVVNLLDADLGRNEETDAELRARRELSVTKAAKSIIDTILAEILAVDNVEKAFIYDNDTDIIDPETLTPPRKFQCVVLGGLDSEIAQAIFSEKPVGIGSFGSTTVEIFDSQGIGHNINFTRPTEVNIYVTVNLSKFNNYPSNGDDLIKQNIVDYANGTLVQGRGFSVGDNVINSQLYTAINLVPGHTINNVLIGLSPSPSSENDIDIEFNQVSVFNILNIVVNT